MTIIRSLRVSAQRASWPVAAALGVVLVIAVFVASRIVNSAGPAPTVVGVDVSAEQAGQALPSGFVGLSLEYSAIHRYLGRDPAAINPVFVHLVAALDPGQAPVLRIGGDSTDHTWWPLPGVVPPAGVSYTLTRNWLATLHTAAVALHARLILGINLAADSAQLAGAEARALIHGVGGQYVDALEIGNEPDVYTDFPWYRTRTRQIGFARGRGWTEPTYAREFTEWAAALPAVPLAGPADAYVNWMSQLPRLIHSEPQLGVVTFHRYPLRGCGAAAVGALAPTISHLLDTRSALGLAASVAPSVHAAHAAGLPFRVDELNSASCGGARGVSNTFASALWVLDALFNLAAVGVDGVNIHSLPGAAYAPFSFRQSHGVWHATVNPLYDGLRLFAQAFPVGARLLTTVTDTSAPVRVWSTVTPAGTVRTLVINDADTTAEVHLRIAGRGGAPVRVETLTAPALAATTGVRLGGARFTPGTTTGVLPAPHTTPIEPQHGVYLIPVAADSAALVTT